MIYIGIDPDVDSCGYAVWDTHLKKLEIKNYSFWGVIERLNKYNEWNLKIIIEAGWLHSKSNWHNEKLGSRVASRIGTKVGANHQVGKLIHEFCILKGIPVELVKPIGKVKSDYFAKLTGYKGRTNQDGRDAAMLVFGK